MALLKSRVLKQRFLVPRIPSAVVYYVHSHLQYGVNQTLLQAVQKFDFQGIPVFRHHGENLATCHQIASKDLRSVNKFMDSFYNFQGDERSKKPQLHMPSNTGTLKSLNPLISQTQLALLSLDYDEKWCKNFETINQKTLDSRLLLEHRKREIFLVAGPEYTDCYKNERDSVWWTVQKYRSRTLELNKSIITTGNKSAALNTLMYTNICKDLCKKTELKKNLQDKCDPSLLETVFQTLRDEIPLFFMKGHEYEIYHKNVTFVNGLAGTTVRGLRAYKISMTSMRIACQLLMTDVTMEILKITKDIKDCNIKVRWRISGLPRFGIFRSRTKQESDNKRYVDGFSVFEVGKDGLIHCHRLLKLMPSQSPERDNPLWILNTAAVISLLRQQKSFEMLARHCVEEIDDTIPLFGAN